ncbi:MAG TPA: quinolinate synthase NadA [Candidatus Thermoplasmatota archaeon]|nr:quinolinate synthase NadA [Candidatus Thermoplasmatota archaeon]
MTNQSIIQDINRLKKKKNAVILAHVYQDGEIQDIADFIGDSLALSKKAVDTDAELIVFCGVTFMAETAHILNPNKTVLLPRLEAGCGLADMATVKELKKQKEKYPDAAVVSYVNSSAEIKSISDVCCTSSNAVNIVNAMKQDTILFVPDKNLGSFIAEHSDKKIIIWDGYCYVHENINPDHIISMKKQHPAAEVIVHPECPKSVRDIANFIGGTGHMAKYVKESDTNEFIVGTEDNFAYRLRKDNPKKTFFEVKTECIAMRKSSLADVKEALEKEQHKIMIDEEVRKKAFKALDNMMNMS